MKFFEDIQVGERIAIGRHTFTRRRDQGLRARASIRSRSISTRRRRERSHFGALCASGWHTAAVWMRLMVDHRRREDEAARARGERVAAIGPALGFRELKWLKPVYAGDTIDYASEVIETRVSDSRPGFGPDQHPLHRRQPAAASR